MPNVDFTTAVRDVDVVLDAVGGDYGPRSLRVLRAGPADEDRGVRRSLDRIAVISDVHGNLTALVAVLADIDARYRAHLQPR
jgi:hypothetical protein